MDEDYKEVAKIAIENWGNTKFIITTTVQFLSQFIQTSVESYARYIIWLIVF